MGKVTVERGCVIGANAVVVKDVLEKNITVAGIPAHKIIDNNSDKFIYWYQ